MVEHYELRVSEEHAHLIFHEGEGKRIDRLTRSVCIPSDDPRIPRIIEIHESLRRKHDMLFGGVRVVRQYTDGEMKSAKILSVKVGFFIQPTGEECGTIYDDASACPMCGAGARQLSELYLKRNRIPRSRDISGTIAQTELVVSQRLFEWLQQSQLSGASLRRVLSPVHLRRRSEGTEIVEGRYQLATNSSPVNIVQPTRIGKVLFGEVKPECPLGHYTGLWPISELSVKRSDWDGSDMFQSKQLFGARMGLLRPFPILFATQQFYRAFTSQRLRGATFEVAHLV